MDETFSESNIKKLLEKCTFEGFRFDYYSKDKGGKKYSPLENIQSIYNRTKSFCDCFDTSEKSLLFYGPTGLGKTYLSCAAAGRLIKEGYTVVYIRATKLFSVFEEYKFGRLEDKRGDSRPHDRYFHERPHFHRRVGCSMRQARRRRSHRTWR